MTVFFFFFFFFFHDSTQWEGRRALVRARAPLSLLLEVDDDLGAAAPRALHGRVSGLHLQDLAQAASHRLQSRRGRHADGLPEARDAEVVHRRLGLHLLLAICRGLLLNALEEADRGTNVEARGLLRGHLHLHRALGGGRNLGLRHVLLLLGHPRRQRGLTCAENLSQNGYGPPAT
uniref:Secreted protein n=1 Tax=Prorocentrum micans TaxID=2945 RepID=A0A7S2TEV0_PROMC|mmetsp:Transcript_773/g.541  ORF Transcript_773/g.541 Transcript_773/m.541 type:complete len:176 (+) Transcript_773:40-567(+)